MASGEEQVHRSLIVKEREWPAPLPADSTRMARRHYLPARIHASECEKQYDDLA